MFYNGNSLDFIPILLNEFIIKRTKEILRGEHVSDLLIWEILGIGTILTSIISAISQLRSELARVNKTLNKIALLIGVPDEVTEDVTEELLSHIAEGKKIKAIKRYRMVTGHGLKESKEYVDSLTKEIT
ncbi:ribosomal protein L7/L12 [Neobacillus drentensis]|uniref:ribosomal protein L7/L12 n=1 Tax=Neobacillus drentensis TaxID=220684 RepID=UPI002FFF0B13